MTQLSDYIAIRRHLLLQTTAQSDMLSSRFLGPYPDHRAALELYLRTPTSCQTPSVENPIVLTESAPTDAKLLLSRTASITRVLAARNDAELFSVAFDDGYVCIGRPLDKIQQLQCHDAGVTYLDWSPSDLMLATASLDGTVKIWMTSSMRPLRTIDWYYFLPHYSHSPVAVPSTVVHFTRLTPTCWQLLSPIGAS